MQQWFGCVMFLQPPLKNTSRLQWAEDRVFSSVTLRRREGMDWIICWSPGQRQGPVDITVQVQQHPINETHSVPSKFTMNWMNYFKGSGLIKQKTYALKRQKDFWKVRKLRRCSCGRTVLTGHFIRHTFQISGYLSCCCLSVIWVDIFSFLGNILC